MPEDVITPPTIEEPKSPVKTRAPKAVASPVEIQTYWSVGRRKTAIARIKLALGNGDITINDKPLEEYSIKPIQRSKVLAPLALVERQDAFDVSVKVMGGGRMAQLDAIALGIARALIQYDLALRPQLKQAHFLTRDARAKERKKYGLKRARKAPQFSKR